MQAKETQFLTLLKNSPQFEIPIFQRTYSWEKPECKQLWDDIIRAGSNDSITTHFIGSIVYIEERPYSISNQSPMLVIDGQQRLTTILLIIEALARRLSDAGHVDDLSTEMLRETYLINKFKQGDARYKLLLTQTDKDSLLCLFRQKHLLQGEENISNRIKQNFDYFERQIKNLDDNLEPLCHGLKKLVVVDVSLNREYDNAQLIFESMNSTGRELSQADLIRNFILMGLSPDEQKRLYEDHWRPMEAVFGQDAYSSEFDKFMRYYLTLRSGELPNIRAVYEAFKSHAKSPEVSKGGIDSLIAEIHQFANYYCAIALDKEIDKELKQTFRDLRALKADVAFPLLLRLYHDFKTEGLLKKIDFIYAVRLIESYVFRRSVCNIATNSLNNTFAAFGRAIRTDFYLESIKAHFQTLPSYRRFPDDDEFKNELMRRDLYNYQRRSYYLRRLENHGRKEPVPVEEFTIEHILPQNESLSARWQKDLGDNWKSIQESFLHTLGNLTLTGYNSEYSDRSFKEKRDIENGFRQSPIKLNEGLGELEKWDEAGIKERARRLSEKAVDVWPAPNLDDDVLLKYRSKIDSASLPISANQMLDDLHNLSHHDVIWPLFEAFRNGVLALDSCVSEEVFKPYIAYKAETNFVDVVPRKEFLSLILNIKFHELNDPRSLAEDVSSIGHHGNGDVRIALINLDDLAYVMGLVRQSFEKQMGEVQYDAQ